jgi:glycosyltransferase involved in cell wall biosynthesis
MQPERRSIVVDGRIIFNEQCRGIGRAVIGWVEHFASESGDGSVKMLVRRGGVSPFDLSGVAKRVELVETDLPVQALHRVPALRHLLAQLNAGVLFSPYHPLTPLAPPCPVVTAVHDCIWEENPAFAGGRARQLGFGLVSHLTLERTTAITVPSLATAHAVHRYYPKVKATEVIPNGVALRHAGQDADATVAAAREALGLPARFLLHVGARRPHKNQRFLLEVLERLPSSLSLVLVGDRDPRMADETDAEIRRRRLGERVLTLQRVPDRYLPGLYEAASVFVFPSLVEGYGIPPLEAMVAGTPVVASAIPVMAEVCEDAALLVSPFDADGWVQAVERVLSDPAAARGLTERGSEVARRATWKRGGKKLYTLLRGLADAVG